MKRVAVENLVVGKQYYVICGIWRGVVSFVGAFQVGKRIKYRFTYGPVDKWKVQFGHFETKSGIKIYEIDEKGVI